MQTSWTVLDKGRRFVCCFLGSSFRFIEFLQFACPGSAKRHVLDDRMSLRNRPVTGQSYCGQLPTIECMHTWVSSSSSSKPIICPMTTNRLVKLLRNNPTIATPALATNLQISVTGNRDGLPNCQI
ncbi:hypothetical protein T4E_3067 [Trichinella pseudospiralis]|uniref:Uncharacterized protein n=1 Tax=Trichinella pseudospiralis TaxID=6337 RepID=A0A0V0XX79_TRIPS|nr:hypothetical protein T4E_3067 [Trichinella pseudospiralis]